MSLQDNLALQDDLAFVLHEDWRKTRLKQNGVYEPSWQVIRDRGYFIRPYRYDLPYISKYDSPYIRRNGNKDWEIDIANAYYSQLSEDAQRESKTYAEVLMKIIESGKYTREGIGYTLHRVWLENNDCQPRP